MPDPSVSSRLQSYVFGSKELKAMTGWPDRVVDEWLNMFQNTALLATTIDGDIDTIDEVIVAVNQLVQQVEIVLAQISRVRATASSNTSNIATNTANIATNTANISDIEQLLYIR